MTTTPRCGATGLRQFINLEQQRNWIEGKTNLRDAGERSESLEQRFKYVGRFEKLLRRPQAQEVLEILRIYGENCLPSPRKTERHYWSVSCLPSTSDKPLVRVNASWMELFTLLADGDGLRARFIVHLSDFTAGEDIFGINVRGSAWIRKFLATPRVLRAIRTFNLTHMNRGRNAYQASHCYSVADYMLAG